MQLSSYRYVDCHKENEKIHSGTATDTCKYGFKCFLWVIDGLLNIYTCIVQQTLCLTNKDNKDIVTFSKMKRLLGKRKTCRVGLV